MAKAGLFPPGPRSRVPGRIMLQLRRDPLWYLTHLARTYGDLISFDAARQRYVVVNHPDLVREVLITQNEAFHKGPALQNSKGTLGDGLLTAEGETHRQQRRLMTPAFYAQHVASYAAVMEECTEGLAGEWRKRLAGEGGRGQIRLDIHHEAMRLTLLIAGRALFGTLLEEETELVRRSMDTLLSMFSRAVVPWGKLLMMLPLASTRRLLGAQGELRGLIDRIIHERRSNPKPEARDLLSLLIAATDPESPARLTDEQLRDQAVTLLTAGHETTANALTYTLYLLAKYPEVQERLRGSLAEADSGFLRAVISESMRLYPPVWTVGRQNQRPIALGGFDLPAKCTVLCPQWTLHRDGRFWAEPLAFNPARWEKPAHPRFAYFPFSTGPRNCIGESFAWLELEICVRRLVEAFRFALPGEAKELEVFPSITLRPRGGVALMVSAASTQPS